MTPKIKIFADGADLGTIRALSAHPLVQGFTTNPSLMRACGITNYKSFAKKAIDLIGDKPISFEVFADEFDAMDRQARLIDSWGANVYVKIPVTNTKGEFSGPLISTLSRDGIKLNVTAVFTLPQVVTVTDALAENVAAIVSVFAGRIADTGRDPVPHMANAKALLRRRPQAELLWASPRETLNIFQAEQAGCDIITVSQELLAKLALTGKDLDSYSLETVAMFHRDAKAAGYSI